MIMIDIAMPDNCDECRFGTEYGFCTAMPENFCGNTDDRKRPEWCPMKEQEAVEPRNTYSTTPSGKVIPHIFCGKCNKEVYAIYAFCPFCGQAVKWE